MISDDESDAWATIAAEVLSTKFFGADGSSFGGLSSTDVHWGICLTHKWNGVLNIYIN